MIFKYVFKKENNKIKTGCINPCIEANIDMIILDRTPFIKSSDHDLIKIQKTPSSIYSAVYPIHFFNKDNFYNFISSHHYEIEIEFKSLDRLDPLATWEGMIIKRMKSK